MKNVLLLSICKSCHEFSSRKKANVKLQIMFYFSFLCSCFGFPIPTFKSFEGKLPHESNIAWLGLLTWTRPQVSTTFQSTDSQIKMSDTVWSSSNNGYLAKTIFIKQKDIAIVILLEHKIGCLLNCLCVFETFSLSILRESQSASTRG